MCLNRHKFKLRKYYAVKWNEEKHLFVDWESCKEFLTGKKGYKYKSFATKQEAECFFSGEDFAENSVNDDLKSGFAVAYTDGSFEEATGKYSFGVIAFLPDGQRFSFCDSGNIPEFLTSRNVAGEVLGVLEAVKWAFLNGCDKLKIYHDYEGLSAWAEGRWQAKGAVSLYYVNRLKRYLGALEIVFEKVKGHSNNSYNEAVDKLAKSALFENKKQIVSGIGCKISGVGEYESLCEYIFRQSRGVKTSFGDDYCLFGNCNEKLTIYKKNSVITICGDNCLLYVHAMGYFYRNISIGGVNRLIERFFDVDCVTDTVHNGIETTLFLTENTSTVNYAPYIIFTLIDIEKRIERTLRSNGFTGDKISHAFIKKDGIFKTVIPFNGAETIEELYAFFYKYRIGLDNLVFTKNECLDFCAKAKGL